ncbi:hypothetical protein [Methanorbis furvi]|uniref:Uncharacterized protein n=1 Tax=Methanorbis furvi TaxID=3028299 RepID=A0AAE4SA59_9EURY|nr:hypothetical protein [Methanocorpusculaceae archaeon Ag1]
MITKYLLLPLILLLLISPCTALSDSAAENDQFTPPAYGFIFASDEIDATTPDKKTAEAFMSSEEGTAILNALIQKNTPEAVPNEILSLTLKNFSYHTADDRVIVRDITVSDLFSRMNTTFTGYGWGGSYETHEYIEISVGDPASRADLKNAWNFIQETAKLNGFTKTIPAIFANTQFIANPYVPEEKYSDIPNATLTLPASGVISVSDEIDSVSPDRKTAEAFFGSPAADIVFDAISHRKNQTPLTLKDFPYTTPDGSVIVRDITAAELFGSMNTTFSVYGWLTSVDTHEYIEIAIEDPAQRSDLINLWNFIQQTAKQNGFEKTIPFRFVVIQFTSSMQDPTPIPTKSSVPILGILGGLGVVAVLAGRKHR